MDIPFAISSIQTMPSIGSVETLAGLRAASPLASDTTPVTAAPPSVVVKLGNVPPEPLTYNSAGVFASSAVRPSTSANMVVNNRDKPGSAGSVFSASLEHSSAKASAAASIVNNDGGTEFSTRLPAVPGPDHFAAAAIENIAENPFYANIATALYLNAAFFRSQHSADVVYPNSSKTIPPVKPLPAVTRL